MAGAVTFLLLGFLLKGVLCDQFKVNLPKSVVALKGSCVTVPCSFDIVTQYQNDLDDTCRALWKTSNENYYNEDGKLNKKIGMTADLKTKDCTTTFNNMDLGDTNNYFFRLECNNGLKYTFQDASVNIQVTAQPPSPTLTPPTLKETGGTSVSLTCSAPAPCLSHPPTLTWTGVLADSQETLQENQDKTKVMTSVLTFTVSHLHDGRSISCTASYKQDGTVSAVSTNLTALVSCDLCNQFKATLPKSVVALKGSCVTVPCSFGIERQFHNDLDDTCRALWKTRDENNEDGKLTKKIGMTADLKKKDCTTTFNNMDLDDTDNYFFRLQCNVLKYNFHDPSVNIQVTAQPPSPTLTPPTLEETEGTSVSLTCSAPAPCWSHPPTLTWTGVLADSQETLQENQDKTKVMTSVLTFTVSHLHDGRSISCTASYKKQDGTVSAVSTNITASVSYSPKSTTVSVSPSGPVPDNSSVTLRCTSAANPAVRSYTWFTADGGQETFIGTGQTLTIKASELTAPFFCKAENSLGTGRSNITHIDVQYSPKNTTVSVSPSGPVPEYSNVTLRCTSAANPAVRSYTWFRADGGQETFIGTGQTLTIKASELTAPFFCKAENPLGAGRSNITHIDVQYSPKSTTVSVSPSGPVPDNSSVTLRCTSAANPAVRSYTWFTADGGQETFIKTGQTLTIKASELTAPVFCKAENSLGTGRSNITHIDVQPKVTLLIPLIITVVTLVLCVLLFVGIRVWRTHHKPPTSEHTVDTTTFAVDQGLARSDANEATNTTMEHIYSSTNELRQAGVPQTETTSESNSTNLPSSGPSSGEDVNTTSEKENKVGSDVVYSTVNFRKKSKKKTQDESVNMVPPGSSYLEEERCIVGEMGKSFVREALEMSIYESMDPQNEEGVAPKVECEYAQVTFKNRKTIRN